MTYFCIVSKISHFLVSKHTPRPPSNNIQLQLASANSSEPIPVIDQLYSPKFPLEVVREFVMGAILDAVQINQVHNR